ncbi:CGNR zinc finger domain-containing protein [Nocardia sp. NPDC058633]|uniref:CGNR zinc finger domain-containing protein n=1 Tax=Nocardia sp. NPDC058633 TaxID=3346568 RepID=UPI003656C0EA
MTAPTPMIGEPLAVDLVNTRPLGADLLASPAQLADWLTAQAAREPDLAVATPTSADLLAIHAVRDHTAAALDAVRDGRRPPESAVRGLIAAQMAAPAILRPTWTGTAMATDRHRTGSAGVRAAAALAEAAAVLLADPAMGKLRRCAADDCVLLFVATHPRRQWCSPARCGNRARVARYYQRHKEQA